MIKGCEWATACLPSGTFGESAMKKLLALAAFSLIASTAFADSATLTGTVRDFTPGPLVPGLSNPDFESGIGGVVPGMVSSTLTGSAPTPIAFGAPGFITSAASFAEWYGPAAPSTSYSITLNETAPGSGIYSFSSGAFFPIDGQLLGNFGSHNYHFTYQIHATFGYTPGAGQVFSFSGDDDVWVFFDKKLGIDLGGVHGSAGATINMDTFFGPGKAAGNYDFDFFYAERHTTESNFTISTSLELVSTPPVPEPETYALMIAGLGMVGFMARRRRKA
jgi:fibro-slime domain-containing protein